MFICFHGEFFFCFVLLNLMCFYNFFFSFHLGCVCILKHMAMHMPPLAWDFWIMFRILGNSICCLYFCLCLNGFSRVAFYRIVWEKRKLNYLIAMSDVILLFVSYPPAPPPPPPGGGSLLYWRWHSVTLLIVIHQKNFIHCSFW